jgi:hypothetical protein
VLTETGQEAAYGRRWRVEVSEMTGDEVKEKGTEGENEELEVSAESLGQKDSPEESATAAETRDPERRKLLVGLGVGAVAAAGAAVGGYALLRPRWAKEVYCRYVAEGLPVGDPDSPLWSKAPAARIQMGPQTMALPTKPEPAVGGITVRSLHDGKKIAFRLEWKTKGISDSTVGTTDFRDACAVLLSSKVDDQNQRVMGSPSAPVTILHWKADWQKDIEEGFQDEETAFPNASFDFYPPLVRRKDASRPVKVPDEYVEAGASRYLAGYAVGNPLSLIDRKTPVEKLRATSPGTLTTFDSQDAEGRGVARNGGWRVVLAKPLRPTDADEIEISPGRTYGVAFAIWVGSLHDVGARKTVSQLLLQLHVDPVA